MYIISNFSPVVVSRCFRMNCIWFRILFVVSLLCSLFILFCVTSIVISFLSSCTGEMSVHVRCMGILFLYLLYSFSMFVSAFSIVCLYSDMVGYAWLIFWLIVASYIAMYMNFSVLGFHFTLFSPSKYVYMFSSSCSSCPVSRNMLIVLDARYNDSVIIVVKINVINIIVGFI